MNSKTPNELSFSVTECYLSVLLGIIATEDGQFTVDCQSSLGCVTWHSRIKM